MSEITQIQLGNTIYDIADSYSRSQLINKADNIVASSTNNGLLSMEDKNKIDNIISPNFSVTSEILFITF